MINQEEAIKIAAKHHGPEFKLYGIYHGAERYNIYRFGKHSWAPDDIWCIICSDPTRKEGLVCSSRAIVIDKESGEILYDGGAGDEG